MLDFFQILTMLYQILMVLTYILHHSQEQAFRPVPQRMDFLVGWASSPPVKGLLRMVQDQSFSEPVSVSF
jgi:hypothetical protein